MRGLTTLIACALFACGPGSRNSEQCVGADCLSGTCNSGESRTCYTGPGSSDGVGPCHGGMQTCTAGGTWSDCVGEVVPAPENCTDGIDNNCNGAVDETVDADGDGFATCAPNGQPLDCCDDANQCGSPGEVNPGAFDTPGDGVDNDCDGMIDNPQPVCDVNLASGSLDAMDFAKAIELCQTATMADKNWGVIDAQFTLADGTGTPNGGSHAILKHYGTGVLPHAGQSLMMISSGYAAGEGDPGFNSFLSSEMGTFSGFPVDFMAANQGQLPNAPGCPPPDASEANDPVMLTLKIRVPTNAKSFSLDVNFFSDEFPEYTCSSFNDFFVVLLSSTYSGQNPNPADKNLAFYTDPTMKKYPVGVNLAAGNTGLFTQCVNGAIGCDGVPGTISTCTSTADLAGTGLEQPAPDQCDTGSLMGGGTGWLTTTGNVNPGEIITLRIAIWDTSDDILDSMAVIDSFRWSTDPSTPGTVIFRGPGRGAGWGVGGGARPGEASQKPRE